MKKIILKIISALLLLSLTGCPGGGGLPNPDPSPLHYISVTAGDTFSRLYRFAGLVQTVVVKHS